MKVLFKQRFNIGIIILLLCLPATNLLAGLTGRAYSWSSDVLMLVSLLLIIDYNTLFHFKLYLRDWKDLLCVALLLWSIVSAYIYGRSSSYSVIYSIFSLAMAVGFATNNRWNEKEQFVRLLFYISGILSVLCAFYLTESFTNFSNSINSVYLGSSNTMIANRVTIAGLPATCICACMAYETRAKFEKVLKWVFVIFSIIALFAVNKRGRVISIVVSLIALLIYKRREIIESDKRLLVRRFLYALIAFLSVAAFLRIPWVSDSLGETVDSVKSAVYTLIGNTAYGNDASAATRYSLRNEILSEYPNFSFFEMLFGKGYMYKYLDFPLLQALIDGGWIFGLAFLVIHLIIPVRNLLGIPQSDCELFVKLFSITGIMSLFYSGVPYGQGIYMYPLMILFLLRTERREKFMMQFDELK